MFKRLVEAVKRMFVIEEKVDAVRTQLSSVEKRLEERIDAAREVLEVKHAHLKERVDHLQVSVDAILSELRLFRGDWNSQFARLTERVVDLTLDIERLKSSKA